MIILLFQTELYKKCNDALINIFLQSLYLLIKVTIFLFIFLTKIRVTHQR